MVILTLISPYLSFLVFGPVYRFAGFDFIAIEIVPTDSNIFCLPPNDRICRNVMGPLNWTETTWHVSV